MQKLFNFPAQQETNQLPLRRGLLYPFNYGGIYKIPDGHAGDMGRGRRKAVARTAALRVIVLPCHPEAGAALSYGGPSRARTLDQPVMSR